MAQPLKLIVRFAVLTAALLFAVYSPYESSFRAQWLEGYIAGVARASAFVIALGDSSAAVSHETLILGRFPLQIVLDCTGIDVQLIFLAAVLATATPWRRKLAGALLGIGFLVLANIARITVLYFVGVTAPERFDFVHEDLLTFGMLVCACLAFAVYSYQAPSALQRELP